MRVTTFLLFVFINSSVFSQVIDTLEEKKLNEKLNLSNSISVKANIAYPLLDNILNSNELYSHYLNWGVHLEYVRSTSRSFGIGIEYCYDISKVNIRSINSSFMISYISQDDLEIYHEGINVAMQTIMPKIEWKNKKSLRPNGFVHQFGLGLTVTSAIKKNYKYRLGTNSFDSQEYLYHPMSNDAEESYDVNQLYNFDNKPFIGGALMYSFLYRRKITESLCWTIGMRAQLNLSKNSFTKVKKRYEFDEEDQYYWINSREMRDMIAVNRFFTFLTLQLGIVYSL